MHGSRSKIHSKNLVRHSCAEGFNFDVKGLIHRVILYIVFLEDNSCNAWRPFHTPVYQVTVTVLGEAIKDAV
jgi:hypothetical protein